MLHQHHADRRQIRHLVAPEPAIRPALVLRELAPRTTARLRVVRNDLIDLILVRKPTARAPMALLPTRLALGALLGQQLLRLRARLRLSLLPRLRRILRRRRRTRPRVPPRLALQPTDPLLEKLTSNPQPLDRLSQLQNERHTTLAPTVVDRLRLGTIHTPEFAARRTESSSCSPGLKGYPRLALAS